MRANKNVLRDASRIRFCAHEILRCDDVTASVYYTPHPRPQPSPLPYLLSVRKYLTDFFDDVNFIIW